MRPRFQLLDEDLAERIITEAKIVLAELGVEVNDGEARELLAAGGADLGRRDGRVLIGEGMVEAALDATPLAFSLFDVLGRETHRFEGARTHFTPGSAAINILDRSSGAIRPAVTADLVGLARLVSRLERMDAQSTALVSSDVPEAVSDSYRLFINLLYCEKAVVTGTFSVAGLPVMRELLLAVRGSAAELAARPLALFTCCPTSPLRWTDEGARDLVECARAGIPVEIVPVPLTGFMAPVTLVGTLIQHTAEVLSGVVIAQLARPGSPLLFGGSPAIFDLRYETTPMGAVETSMLTAAAAEIGRRLGLPTQGYIALSDAKALDAQAGLETGIGATLAALAGIDNVSGPGMLDFESCQSLEKLVVDHEICRMAERLSAGIEAREDFPARPLLEELLAEKHLLIADHTRRHLRSELSFPGPVIDRTSRPRWLEEGGATLGERAAAEVDRLLAASEPSRIPDEARRELERIMTAAARAAGLERLPPRPE
ncbi:MAG: trimethylamine methyltransferase family protein [Thermoanaerobaculales bacterium]|jgi:trimethylamine--corrinoid protein Co-methyltransferase|nr:trimethylamine methyltransferase family protein [Thermoanaerobaculales bacterium]